MTLDEALASGRHVVTYGAGFMTAFGLTKVVDPNVLVTSFDHIFNGVKEISIGVGPLAAVAMGWWATHRSTPAAKVADVSAMPTTKGFVTTDPALAGAAKEADPQTQVTLAPPLDISSKGQTK